MEAVRIVWLSLVLSSYMPAQRRAFCPMCEMMGGWGWLGMISIALFWIAVIAGIVWLVLRLIRRTGS